MKQHTVHRLPTRPSQAPPKRVPKQHEVHRLPTGAFSAIIGARRPSVGQAFSLAGGFTRHFDGQETPLERRFRVPLTSVPKAAAPPRRASRTPPPTPTHDPPPSAL